MGQVTITLNARSYKLRCGDGEEARLLDLAAYVQTRLDKLTDEFGQVGDERILVMTTLMIADDLFDAREAMTGLQGTPAPPPVPLLAIAQLPPDLPTEPSVEHPSVAVDDAAGDGQMVEEAEGGAVHETALNRPARRSETPVSINERLAEARESALLHSGDRKP